MNEQAIASIAFQRKWDGIMRKFLNIPGGEHRDALLFVKQKIDVNVADKYGRTTFSNACFHQHMASIRYLLDEGACTNCQTQADKETPLMCASLHGNLTVVTLLLVQNANLNLQNHDGDTALMLATKKGHDDIVKHMWKQP